MMIEVPYDITIETLTKMAKAHGMRIQVAGNYGHIKLIPLESYSSFEGETLVGPMLKKMRIQSKVSGHMPFSKTYG